MKQFISILISFVLMGLADNIDDFFNNAISLNTIVVCGCLFTIDIFLNAITQLGIATYRTVRKNEWSYLFINIISSLVVAVLVFIAKDYIVNIFDLTNYQKELLSSILSIYIFYLTIGRTSNAIFEMIRLKGNLKLYNQSLILFYITLIGFDLLAFIFTKSLILLFVATILAWLISIIFMLYKSKFKFTLPVKEDLNNVLTYGLPTILERLIVGIYILIYTVMASHMGMEKYAIHTICFAVYIHLEVISDAYFASLMIDVPLNKPYQIQHKTVKDIQKQCFKVGVLFNYVLCFVYLFISHGSLPIQECFPYIFFYTLAVFALFPYETYKVLCICQGKTKMLVYSVLVATIVSLIPCLIFIKTPLALFAFGISILINFIVKKAVLKLQLKKEFGIV